MVPLRVLSRLLPVLSDADLVHFHDIDLLPLMAALSVAKPIVYDVHENYGEEMLVREWIPEKLRKPLSAAVMAQQSIFSRVVRNIVLVVDSQDVDFSSPRLRVHHLYNYASSDLLAGVNDDYCARNDVLLFTGSSYTNNGTLLLLEVASRLREVLPYLRVHLTDRFSSTAFRDQVLSEIESRGLRDYVLLRPNVPPHELAKVMNEATIAIIPALRVPKAVRAIPTKLFEFMAAGLPVVASDLPHLTRIIEGAKCGHLARPEDPESFVSAIRTLVEDRAKAKEVGNNGRRAFVDRYTWECQIPGLVSFYERILSDRQF
jgi:glycosyltransferase involved in cell wall biosynthesis